MVDFAKVYADVYLRKYAYCSLCFRSEKEARLIEPLMFKEAMRALNLSKPKEQSKKLCLKDKVCYMCEARAGAVVKFLNNIHLAIKLQTQLCKAAHESGAARAKRFQQKLCQDDFVKMRKKTELTRIDFMLMSAGCGDRIEKNGVQNLHNFNAPEVITKPECNLSNKEIVTVIIDNDESLENAADDYLQEMNSPTSLKSTQMPIPTSVLSPNDQTIGATVGQDGFLYTTTPVCKKPTAPIKRKSDRHAKTNTKKHKADDTKLYIFIENPPSKTEDDDVILICDDEARIEEADEHVATLPVRNNSSVDWEDKIPMELISFGDSVQSAATSVPLNELERLVLIESSVTASCSAIQDNQGFVV